MSLKWILWCLWSNVSVFAAVAYNAQVIKAKRANLPGLPRHDCWLVSKAHFHVAVDAFNCLPVRGSALSAVINWFLFFYGKRGQQSLESAPFMLLACSPAHWQSNKDAFSPLPRQMLCIFVAVFFFYIRHGKCFTAVRHAGTGQIWAKATPHWGGLAP